jgi:hypothetical protein
MKKILMTGLLGFLLSWTTAMAVEVQNWKGLGSVQTAYGQETNCEASFSFSRSPKELEIVAYSMTCSGSTIEVFPLHFEIVGNELRLGGEVVGNVSADSFHFKLADEGISGLEMDTKISDKGVMEQLVIMPDLLGSGMDVRATSSLHLQ